MEWRGGVVDLRPSTLARDDGYIARYLLPVFERRRLADIDHADVQAWVAQLPRAMSASPSARKRVASVFVGNVVGAENICRSHLGISPATFLKAAF